MKYPLLALILSMVIGCQQKPDPKKQFASRLDSLLTTQFRPGEPGAAVLVAKGEEVLFTAGYGLADMQTHDSINAQTLFNLGSISKTFVAHAILLLQQEGKLSVEDSLTQYFPNFKNKKISDRVRIRHLLTHSSGLPDLRNVSGDSVFFLTAKDKENWYPITQADSLEFEPGTQYHYSNPAFNGLALIVEQVSGQPWQQFVHDRILKPSGMTTSTITDGPHPESHVAHAYYPSGNQWVEDDYGEEPTFPAAGNGGVWSSLEELRLYEKALVSGVFLDPAVVADARTPKNDLEVQALSPDESRTWRLGWSWFIGSQLGRPTFVGHSGTQGGFYCNYISIPEKGVLFVLLSNRPCDRPLITEWILRELAANNWFE